MVMLSWLGETWSSSSKSECSGFSGALTSLLRSAGIPARPVIVDGHGNNAFDTTTELWVNESWYVFQGYNSHYTDLNDNHIMTREWFGKSHSSDDESDPCNRLEFDAFYDLKQHCIRVQQDMKCPFLQCREWRQERSTTSMLQSICIRRQFMKRCLMSWE